MLFNETEGVPGLGRTGVAVLLAVIPLGLVFAQPDLGTSMVYLWLTGIVLLVSGVRVRYLLLLAATGAATFFVGLRTELIRDYQLQRLTVFLGADAPDADFAGALFQTRQSMIAIGSGGTYGRGLFEGTQTALAYVPDNHTDFIFTVVGEEFGFIGCAWLLLLYFMLLARILALSRDALSLYERYICYGASAVIFFHVFIAVGMTIRLAPITGLPLPFVSYGGSALMTMWLLMAILQSIYANSRRDFRTARPRN